jgi:phosphocarrier protein FPr
MLPGRDLAVEVAAGDVDGGLGTDATAIAAALAAADDGDGVVVLLDLGSAVLSAETALDLVDGDLRERVVLSPAPLVEGLVGAVVTAAAGAPLSAVAAEALRGLAPKQAHLGG